MARGYDTALGRFRRLLPSIVGGAVLVAVILACGASPVSLKTAPASQLQLQFVFWYTAPELHPTTPLPPGKVLVRVDLRTEHDSFIVLAGGQDLVCDGVEMLHPDMSNDSTYSKLYGRVLLDQQPPDGKHICVYTDEKGQQTTAVIPMPTGQLAIVSPRAGAHVPIPPYINPSTTPDTPSDNHSPSTSHEPLTITYTKLTLPSGAHAQLTFFVDCRMYRGGSCNGVAYSPSHESTVSDGVYALNYPMPPDAYNIILDSEGSVTLTLDADWSQAPQGFQSVQVMLRESVTNAITWVHSE
jgi:hypothetical protein